MTTKKEAVTPGCVDPAPASKARLGTRAAAVAALVALLAAGVLVWTAPARREAQLKAMPLQELQRAAASAADDERAYYYLGLRQRGAGDLSGAIASFRHAAQYGVDDVQAWKALSQAESDSGNYDSALNVLDTLTKYHPRDSAAHAALAQFCSQRAMFRAADYEAQTAAQLDPGNADLWSTAGQCAIDNKDTKAAVTDFSIAVHLAPDNWRDNVLLGSMYASDNQTSQAMALYKKAYSLAPQEAGTQLALGALLAQFGATAADRKQAVMLLEEVVKSSSPSAPPWRWLGLSLSETGNDTGALDAYTHAVDIDPTDADDHYKLQMIYTRLGNRAAARREEALHDSLYALEVENTKLRDVTHARPNDIAAGLKYARFCMDRLEYADAVTEYRRLAAIAPASRTVREEMETAETRLSSVPGSETE